MNDFEKTKDNFIQMWGTLGNSWGMNRTFAQVHGLLMVSEKPLSTDDVMHTLSISRGNAHSNLKELQNWGLIKLVHIHGERKDYYQGLKDPWDMFYIIAQERKRRELNPIKEILTDCIVKSGSFESEEAKAFNAQLKDVSQFVQMASSTMDKLMDTKKGNMFKWLLKRLG